MQFLFENFDELRSSYSKNPLRKMQRGPTTQKKIRSTIENVPLNTNK